MPPTPLYDLTSLPVDFAHPQYSLDDIRLVNPQRHEMEQLSGILYVDREGHGLVGFKDLTDREFWCIGHMPGYPLMPGVVMCECAAQLGGFYARKFNLLGGDFLGFGGMDEVRFRHPVFPNQRLVLMSKVTKVRPGIRVEFEFQGYVNDRMVFNGNMIGVPISWRHGLEGKDA